MRLKLKEDPREWRKSGCLGALGLAVASTILHWRRVLPPAGWLAALAVLSVIASSAWLRPGWFRGYYRFSSRVGFAIVEFGGRAVLALFFIGIIVPLGLLFRVLGKDPLRLKRPPSSSTYWIESKENSPLDRMF
jgi:hypothetical protein